MNSHILTPTVTYALAARAVEIALNLAAQRQIRAVVTVVDPSMAVVAIARADGATPHNLETSRRKAATAASTRKATSAIPREIALTLEHGSGGLLTSIDGGVPLSFAGVHVGGLGIAGGPPTVDAEIAAAVLAELGADSVAQL